MRLKSDFLQVLHTRDAIAAAANLFMLLRERARKLERNHPGSDAVLNPPRYLPTEEETYAECETIQATWSPREAKCGGDCPEY